MAVQTAQSKPLSSRIQAQFGLLIIQFLLGMAVNLIGLPNEVSGGVRTFDQILLGLHVLAAVGLIINAVMIARWAGGQSPSIIKLARGSAAAIGLATIFGVLTLSGHWSNLWSYGMAVSFIAAFALYGRLFSESNRT